MQRLLNREHDLCHGRIDVGREVVDEVVLRHPGKAVLVDVEMRLHWSAVEEVMGVPVWKSLPSWFLIADGDQVIPPDAQRQFAARMGATTVEVSINHVAMVSHPDDVQLIKTAVEAVGAAT